MKFLMIHSEKKYSYNLLHILSTAFSIFGFIGNLSAQQKPYFPPPQEISSLITKETFIYSVKGNDSLGLDVYTLKNMDSSVKKPCIIFVFGGAFVIGRRDDSVYNSYFNFLVQNNYIVVSISYRLGLKGVRHVSKFNIKPLKNAVDMAVDDAYDATNWVVTHAQTLGVDTSQVLLSGSSSGAITVLTAEFERKNEYPESAKLPAGFQYAGVISFSGAILSFHGKLSYKNKPAPKLMFHGTADKIVTYTKIRFFNKGFYGSSWIAKVAAENNDPYYLYSDDGLGHEVAVLPMVNNLTEIQDFLNRFIVQHKNYQINLHFKDPDQKPVMLLTSEELMKKLN
jgi:hypothetical protein